MEHFFYKGKEQVLKFDSDFDEKLKIIKKELLKTFESRNLSFLIGSGCSLGTNGIPTMKELACTLFVDGIIKPNSLSPELQKLMLEEVHLKLLTKHNINIEKDPFKNNLEIFLGTLYSLRFYLEQINDEAEVKLIDDVIEQTKNYILYRCLNEENKGKDESIEDVYKNFYRKLSLRDSNLPKPNVFTTNYDMYSEKAMDDLGITYTNGFSGFVKRYFNPSIFNYALAEQMDISSFKWNVIDSFIYLFKIHGSVNWIEVEDTNKLFKVEELQNTDFKYLKKRKQNIMIYPSPTKQNASLGSPYSDLFREFQKRITQNQSVLITMGFSFSDEHINNLIYQALTIPTFRLVVFCDSKINIAEELVEREVINKLIQLNDPRIWIIGTNNNFVSPKPNLVPPPPKSTSEVKSLEKSSDIEAEEIKEDPVERLVEFSTVANKDIDASVGTNIDLNVEIKEKYLHFFSTIIEDIFPDWTENRIEESNAKIIDLLHKSVTHNAEN